MPGAMFVSGFVSPSANWVKFEKEWVALLHEYGIANPFHMTDFANGAKQFAAWKDDKEKRTEFYSRAIKLINKRTHKDFSQGVLVDDFWRMHREYEIPSDFAGGVLSSPYAYCAVGAFVKVVEWVRRYVKKDGRLSKTLSSAPIEFVYDRGDHDRGEFATIMRREFKINPIRRSTKDAVPIQAADVLAWEHAKWQKEQLASSGRPTRESLIEMARVFPGSGEWVFGKWEGFGKYCEGKGFPKKMAN